MRIYLMVDFGSTYTKVTAVDLDGERLLGRSQSPTTIETDITIGLNSALDELYANYNLVPGEIHGKYACSSAAGGLKMAAIGLVPDLTLKAAQMAALGAGAKVVCSYGYEIDGDIASEIEKKQCDIVLLCGGTDGGNKNVILYNAEVLANSNIACPILLCGNRSVAQRACLLLEAGGKKVYKSANVLPAIDRVDVGPAQELIRKIFIRHIIQAKGLDNAQTLFKKDIIPTPMASLNAASLLADGTSREQGIGSLMVVEVGGATTNIHSIEDNSPATALTIIRGLPEPRVSRTVEGDMGIRFNARTIFDFEGKEQLTASVFKLDETLPSEQVDLDAYTELLGENASHVPKSDAEALMDIALAKASVHTAAVRHAGHIKSEYTASGEVTLQYGKNLLNVKNVVGTGGIFKYGKNPGAVLESALFSKREPWSLMPKSPTAYVDSDYLLYAVGLLSQEFPDEALRIAKKYLKRVEVAG
ncbi:MAG: methylaspartate mutase accessory protein GlmL [Oscillospiraceae bacterium]|nr:methylaspartate mutase accessory protein GlmL [Oscillospiraceae bacterium]